MRFPSNANFAWKESDLQEAAAEYLQFLEDRGWLTFTHVPMGGKREKWVGAQLKRHGARKGHPDLDVYLRGGKTIFFELKTMIGEISKAQIDRTGLLTTLGFEVHVILAESPQHCINQIARILRENQVIIPLTQVERFDILSLLRGNNEKQSRKIYS